MAGVALLVLGALSLEHTAVALLGPRRPDRLGYVWFLQGLVTGELAWLHLVWQWVLAAGLVALGALGDATGIVGIVLLGVSAVGLVVLQWQQTRAAPAIDRALRTSSDPPPTGLPPATGRVRVRSLLRPLTPDPTGVVARAGIAYGDHPRQQVDVLQSANQQPGAPVLVHVHGGGWVGGRPARQSRALRYEFARRGWVSISAGYRVSPEVTFPEHLIDIKRVIAWAREHADELGGSPDHVVVSGVSSGAHLASLAALTPNDPVLQPGFTRADTSVIGCIATSGIYDLLDRAGDHPGSRLVPFLAHTVMKSDPEAERQAWDAASPLMRVHAGAPPFLVIHGHDDALAWREEARRFVTALRAVSRSPVAYAELPATQHAFETFSSVRSMHVAFSTIRFAEWLCHDIAHGAQRIAGRARG